MQTLFVLCGGQVRELQYEVSVCLSVVQCVSLLLLVQVPSSALNTATHRPKAHLLRTEELSELRFV